LRGAASPACTAAGAAVASGGAEAVRTELESEDCHTAGGGAAISAAATGVADAATGGPADACGSRSPAGGGAGDVAAGEASASRSDGRSSERATLTGAMSFSRAASTSP